MAVTVRDIQEKLRLSVVYGDDKLLSKEITTADISRPGLEMTGYFDYYTPERDSACRNERMVLLGEDELTTVIRSCARCSSQRHLSSLLRGI